MENNLKILEAEITNFKNLTKKQIEINGQSLIIVGANDASKSSVIQALFAPFLDTYKPIEPIKKGEDNGSIKVKIGGHLEGEEVEYTANLFFSRETQKGRLTLLNKEGENIKSPKSALESIIGDISFNIDRFIQLSKTPTGKHSSEGAKSQVEMLKSFMPRKAQEELVQCDIDRLEVFNQRKEINAEIKLLEAGVVHDYSDEDLEKYSAHKSEEELNKKIIYIGGAIEDWQHVVKGVIEAKEELDKANLSASTNDHYRHQISVVTNCIDSLQTPNDQQVSTFLVRCHEFKKEQINYFNKSNESKKSIPKLEEKIKKGDQWLKSNPKPTTESLLKEQKHIQEHNSHCDKILGIKKAYENIRKKKDESTKLTEQIDGFINRKKRIFSEHPLPVEGLTFDEDQVYYRELPFNEETHPSSTIIGVGLLIAMALKPNLRTLVIKDGSLLDKGLFNKILGMCEEKGFQLIIEMVSWEGRNLDIQFAEKQV